MTTLRDAAEGKPCLVRLQGCDGGGPTTVLAHFPLAGYRGMGIKPPDYMAARSCFNCHEIIDGRKFIANLTKQEVRLAHAEGVMRTHAAYEKEGLLWKD